MAEAFADPDEFPVKVASRPLPVATVEPWDPVTEPRARGSRSPWPRDARLDRLACFVSGQGKVPVEWLDPR